MKKLLSILAVLAIVAVPASASAKSLKTTTKTKAAVYTLPVSYRSVYCYDGGSYWTAQKNAYPDYYAANNAYYEATYGANTWYCPVN